MWLTEINLLSLQEKLKWVQERRKERLCTVSNYFTWMNFCLVYGSTVCIVGAAVIIAMLTGVNTLRGPVQQTIK